jgi:DNA-binding NtrC family response regulator
VKTKKLWIGADIPKDNSDIQRVLEGYNIIPEACPNNGLKLLNGSEYSVVLYTVDPHTPHSDEVLHQVLHDPRFPVIIHHPNGTLDDAIRSTRQGAFYVLLGELQPDRVEHAIKKAVERRRPVAACCELDGQPWRRLLIGESPAMQHICEVIKLIAPKRATVLISGETGTGKEVVAKTIHYASTRANRPMVAINCTALPANLVETELFGHTKGAFTGATGSRMGRFEQANRGTLFLDEIGDLPLETQAKLLRVLQEQEFERVGSSETVHVDVRVLTATNVNLEEAVHQRRFREDLFYRLNVVPIHIPALRERREDIPLLLEHFLEKIQKAENGPPKRISPDAVDLLTNYDWPGNVRQLEHAVHKAIALSGDRPTLFSRDFAIKRPLQVPSGPVQVAAPQVQLPSAHVELPSPPLLVTPGDFKAIVETPLIALPEEGLDFDAAVSAFELSLLNQALASSGGNKARAADLLKMKRTTLLAKMKTLEERGLTGPRAEAAVAAPRPVALIYEENAAVRKLVGKSLEAEGYRVMEAATETAATDLVQCWATQVSLIVAPAAISRNGTPDVPPMLRSLKESVPMIIVSEHHHSTQLHVERPNTTMLQSPFSTEEFLASLRAMNAKPKVAIAGSLSA